MVQAKISRGIADSDIVRIREGMPRLGAEIGQFGAALEARQASVRKAIIPHSDAAERNTERATP